jgi:uncharacterized protein (TIGR02246 family)
MRIPVALSIVFVGELLASVAVAQERPPAVAAAPVAANDDEAVRAAAEAYSRAFNAEDTAAIADAWTADGNYVNEEGEANRGRDAIAKKYAAFFAQNNGVTMQMAIANLKLLNPTTAMTDGTITLQSAVAGTPLVSRFSDVYVKQGEKWLLENVRTIPARPTIAQARLKDLDGLVGEWSAKRDEAVVRVSWQWILERKFMQRTYEITEQNRLIASGVHVIGWDAGSGQIKSWTFDSMGSSGSALWTRTRTGGWNIVSEGELPDGTPTSGIEILFPAGRDAVSWQAVGQYLGDLRVPDTKEVLLKRVEAKK